MGAYTLNVNGRSQIIFCPLFFQAVSLDSVKKTLDQNPEYQHDLTWMLSSAKVFLHEMTHLAVIDGTKPSNQAQPREPVDLGTR
jgi:hypothetical protein